MGLPSVREWEGEPPHPPADQSTWQTQRVIFSIRAIWIVALASALMYVTRYAINSWGVLYLQEAKGYSLMQAGSESSGWRDGQKLAGRTFANSTETREARSR